MLALGKIGMFRRTLVLGGVAAVVGPYRASRALDRLKIDGKRGTIDFSIGDSKVFRTTGSFKDWSGMVDVDDANVMNSKVDVQVNTKSIEMLDVQQTAMLKDTDFFDVEKFPEMVFHSTEVERVGETALKVTGDVTLRGITKPMVLNVSVTDRKPDAQPGQPYARFRGEGKIKRSEFGMTKFIDMVGDVVDISIRADAWR
jgi:polyisoprenoid-binding protein YceI